jgi:hypothetical protein
MLRIPAAMLALNAHPARLLMQPQSRPMPSMVRVPFPNLWCNKPHSIMNNRHNKAARCDALVNYEQRARRCVPQHHSHLRRNTCQSSAQRGQRLVTRTWCVSDMNELCAMADDTLSALAMRVKMRSVRPTVAESEGTKLPTCARNTMSATCFCGAAMRPWPRSQLAGKRTEQRCWRIRKRVRAMRP